jgi:hypothetical protein
MTRFPRSASRPASPLVPRPLILALALAFAPHAVRAAPPEPPPPPAPPVTTVPVVIDTDVGNSRRYGNSNDGGVTANLFPASGHALTFQSGGKIGFNAYGGYHEVSDNVEVSNNVLTFDAGLGTADTTASTTSYGGYARTTLVSATAKATGNHVYILDGKVGGITGGYATSSVAGSSTAATGNYVRFAGGETIASSISIHGGYASANVGGSVAKASDNYVDISDGTLTRVSEIYGGYAKSTSSSGGDFAEAEGNWVFLSGGTLMTQGALSILGGYAYAGYSNPLIGTATAKKNGVVVSGVDVPGNVYGARIRLEGKTFDSEVADNAVYLLGGSVSGNIFGGYIDTFPNYTQGTATASATDNRVYLSNGSVGGNVFGGYAWSAIDTLSATDNTVTLSGPVSLAGRLYGGFVSSSSTNLNPVAGRDAFSGNRLELKTSGLTAAGVYNFEFLDFYLPPGLGNGGTVLTVSGGGDANLAFDDDGDNTPDRSSTINVGIGGEPSLLAVGDTVILIDVVGGGQLKTHGDLNSTATGQGMLGVSLCYESEFDIEAQGDQLVATVTRMDILSDPDDGHGDPPRLLTSKTLSEGYLSGLALVERSVDLVAGQGMDAARDALSRGRNGFVLLGGDSSRHKTGSHVDIDSQTLTAGVSGERRAGPGTLALGAFLVHGQGDYDTYNSLAAAASVKGHGDTEHTGLGLLARLDLAGTDTGHPYAEVSLQGGRVKSSFRGPLVENMGETKYKSRSTYHGAHLAAGYAWNFSGRGELDLYSRLLYTRRGGDTAILETPGVPVSQEARFKAIESKRARIGGRYTLTGETFKPYAGLAWEHEFDGRARATLVSALPSGNHRQKIDAPDMKGNTGIVELGFTLAPGKTRALTVDLGIQGYAGQRKGASASARMEYRF